MGLKEEIENHHSRMMEIIRSAGFTVRGEQVDKDKWVDEVLDIIEHMISSGKRIFFIGNGASCSIASHFAADFTKNGGIRSYPCNDGTLLTCFSNDFSHEEAYMEIIKRYMDEGDALIAISSSGCSENILNAAQFVSDNFNNNPIITLSGFKQDNPLRAKGWYNLFLGIEDYGFVESGHAYFLHLLLDMLIKRHQEEK